MEHSEIQLWLLILTLIFPRLGLIIAWFGGQIPYNTIPFVGDMLMAVFLPRLLMIIHIVTNLGTGSGWFWIHLFVFIISFGFTWVRIFNC
jgi:hypothetical protein